MGLYQKGNAEVASGPLHRLQAPDSLVSCHHHEYVTGVYNLLTMRGYLMRPLLSPCFSSGALKLNAGALASSLSPALSHLRGSYVTTRIHHRHWQSDGGTCMSLLRLHVQLGIDQRMWRVQPSFLLSSDLPNTARQLQRPRGGAYKGQPRRLIYHPAVSLALQQPPSSPLPLYPANAVPHRQLRRLSMIMTSLNFVDKGLLNSSLCLDDGRVQFTTKTKRNWRGRRAGVVW